MKEMLLDEPRYGSTYGRLSSEAPIEFLLPGCIARCTSNKMTFHSLYPGLQSQGGYGEEPPFESNFSWDFWFYSSPGLHYMHGAGSQV